MNRLKDKVAIITGAAQGMGASHARVFVEEGAQVVLTDLNAKAGQALAKELGPHALFIQHDVTKAAEWKLVRVLHGDGRNAPIDVGVEDARVREHTAQRRVCAHPPTSPLFTHPAPSTG